MALPPVGNLLGFFQMLRNQTGQAGMRAYLTAGRANPLWNANMDFDENVSLCP